MLLPAAVEAVLAGRTVRAATLLLLEWVSSTSRVWLGNGTLDAGGEEWGGTGTFVSLDGMTHRNDLSAVSSTITLSGVDSDMVVLARTSAAEAKGRPATVFIQFFDDDNQTLDDPIAIHSGLMDVVSYKAKSETEREISVSVEGVFAARGSAPFAYYTDRDQQARFPGDRGMEEIASLITKVIKWGPS